MLNNSASLHHAFWYNTLGKNSGDADSGSFNTTAEFQKAMYWYNGMMSAGASAMPPLMSASELWKHGAIESANLRILFGGTPNPGHGAANRLGNVTMPTLFVCGQNDTAILCSRPYALKTLDVLSSVAARARRRRASIALFT